MMGFTIYCIIGFIIFFVMWRMSEEKRENMGRYDMLVEKWWFWDTCLVPLFWPLALPMKVAWKLLDKLWNKYMSKYE